MNEPADLQGVDAADEQFRVLALRYLADELDSAESKTFEQLLATSDDRCEEFSALAMQARLIAAQLSSQIESEAAIRGSQTTAAFADATRPVRTPVLGFLGRVSAPLSRPVFWSIAGVGILFVGYVVAITWNMLGEEAARRRLKAVAGGSESSLQPSANSVRPDAVATITGSQDAIWAEESETRPLNPRPWPGLKWDDPQAEITSSERLHLASGLVELQLMQGTTLVVEGPAEWTVDGDNAATLHRGRLSAVVSKQATGFTVRTPTAQIVDLGTEFGVFVNDEGSADVHVFSGRVTVAPTEATGNSENLGTAIEVVSGRGVSVYGGRVSPFSPEASASGARRFRRHMPVAPVAKDGMPSLPKIAFAAAKGGYQDRGTYLRIVQAGKLIESGLAVDGKLGKPGTTLYVSWLTRDEVPSNHFGGLSFFLFGDSGAAEKLFVGRTGGLPNYAIEHAGLAQNCLDRNPETPEIEPCPADRVAHRLVMRFRFRSGSDEISVFIDPPAGEPVTPNLWFATKDIEFDRLRFAVGAAGEWTWDDLRFGTTWREVVP